jgi:4a-hydroxytetrahydrobiopterin dehydratase
VILQSWHGSTFFDTLVLPPARTTVATLFLNPRVNQMSSRLDETAVIAGLKTLKGWQLASDDEQRPAIERDYSFTSFNAAFGFMGRVALVAERANHHPELLNRYRRVLVRWTSHSEGGVTALDLELAATCDKLAINSGLKTLDTLK